MNPNFKSIETKKNENSKFFGFLVPFYQLIIIGNSIVCKKKFFGMKIFYKSNTLSILLTLNTVSSLSDKIKIYLRV